MKSRSFLFRPLFLGWIILSLALLGLFFTTFASTESQILDDFEHRAERDLLTVKWLLVSHPDFKDGLELDSWAKELGKHLEVRITFVAAGQVIADTMVEAKNLETLEDHSSRPEIVQAKVNEVTFTKRYSDTLQENMLYAATLIPPVSGLPYGVLRLALPEPEIRASLLEMRRRAVIAFVVALLASALLFLYVARRLGLSVQSFARLALDIGEGNYDKRIRDYPGDEFRPLANAINSMARSIGKHVGTIEEQGGRLRALFQGMSEGVLVLDEKGRIQSFNRAMEIQRADIADNLGRTLLEALFPLELQDAADDVRSGTQSSLRLPLALEDRHLDISVVPFEGYRNGRKLALVFRDVSAEVEYTRMLKDFVANASHQLRTPLTSIRGYAETLLDSPPENLEMATKFLRIINRNAEHMDGVLTSLLVLAKSDKDARQGRHLEPLNASALARAAVADLTPKAEEAGLQLCVDFPQDDVLVTAQSEGLLDVFHNLLSNAISYGGGTIELSCRLRKSEAEFSVRDHGPGIASDIQDKVFERFFRGDPNAIDNRGGAGLGLAICRQIIENYGGSIRLESPSDGSGALFLFTLPLS